MNEHDICSAKKNVKRKMKNIFLKSTAVVSFASIAILYGCSGKSQAKGTDPAIVVKIETVHESEVINILEYVGIIEEKTSVALGFPVMGTIERINVSEGELIHKGQLLAELNQVSARSMLDAAKATLQQAKDAYDRLKPVFDKGSLPEIQMVDIETKLRQAQSSYDLAEQNLKNCLLYAPADGVVGKKMAEAGEYTIPGTAVLTILDISSVKAGFSVPENEISGITSDCKSEISVTALGNLKFEGRRIEKSVMANPISHTYPVHINLNNTGRELLPGMVCSVRLTPANRSKGIVVPIGIIQTTADNQKFVWCDRDGVAKRTIVTTGAARGNGVEILTGLKEGDRIVTGGYHKISEDDKITGR